MASELSSNVRDGLSASSSSMINANANNSLQLSVEQWELLRRLRNSHLTKAQIIRAYDELDRLDRELGNLFNNGSQAGNFSSHSSSTLVHSTDPVSPPTNSCSPSSVSNNNNHNNNPNKRSHSQTIPVRTLNGYHASHSHHSNSSSSTNNRTSRGSFHDSIPIMSNQNEPFSQIDFEEETRELQELLSRGEMAVHNEISVFVYRYDLKQSQIARMAAVNQAYVSKFLRGDLYDLSENGRMAICRWYLRYKKIVQCMGGAQAAAEFFSNYASSYEPTPKIPRLMDSQSNSSHSLMTFDTPKRTRFTFRPEHLDILEKAFLDNPYPDPRRREDIARICNEARTRVDGTNETLSERDRVTDAIVTHWFQNKRKMAKSQRVSITEDSMSSNNPQGFTTMIPSNDYENGHVEDESHQNHRPLQKSPGNGPGVETFEQQNSTLDPQIAAYRAIMSRMVPFGCHRNERFSPKRFLKQEAHLNREESSHEDDSSSQSPLQDHLSP